MENVLEKVTQNSISGKVHVPEELELWEINYFKKILSTREIKKPGKRLGQKLDYYLIPGSLLRRDTKHRNYTIYLSQKCPEEFKISEKERKIMDKDTKKAQYFEFIRGGVCFYTILFATIYFKDLVISNMF